MTTFIEAITQKFIFEESYFLIRQSGLLIFFEIFYQSNTLFLLGLPYAKCKLEQISKKKFLKR